jgi:hypothetical protein
MEAVGAAAAAGTNVLGRIHFLLHIVIVFLGGRVILLIGIVFFRGILILVIGVFLGDVVILRRGILQLLVVIVVLIGVGRDLIERGVKAVV